MTHYALVTGASRNIGRAIAARLKADGYSIVMLDKEPPEDPDLGIFHQVDLGDADATSEALEWALDGRTITRLVNCAGVITAAKLEDITVEDFERVMGINTRAFVQTTQALAPGMKSAGFGRILNVASRSALGIGGLGVYGASKGAIVTLTKAFAMELAPFGITCNAVGPGPIETDLMREVYPVGSEARAAYLPTIPVGKFGQPEDVAHTTSFFLDERSWFVTGQVLYVCGGLTVGLANT